MNVYMSVGARVCMCTHVYMYVSLLSMYARANLHNCTIPTKPMGVLEIHTYIHPRLSEHTHVYDIPLHIIFIPCAL